MIPLRQPLELGMSESTVMVPSAGTEVLAEAISQQLTVIVPTKNNGTKSTTNPFIHFLNIPDSIDKLVVHLSIQIVRNRTYGTLSYNRCETNVFLHENLAISYNQTKASFASHERIYDILHAKHALVSHPLYHKTRRPSAIGE